MVYLQQPTINVEIILRQLQRYLEYDGMETDLFWRKRWSRYHPPIKEENISKKRFSQLVPIAQYFGTNFVGCVFSEEMQKMVPEIDAI